MKPAKAKGLLVAYFGTPRFSVRVLERLAAHNIVPALVVTAPDRPKGRGRVMTPPEAKEWALARGIDVAQPHTLKEGTLVSALQNSEWDLFIVASYGKIFPKEVLSIPKHGVLNVHPSLLPKLRGPSPVISSILADERETGVSIMLLDEEMDHGPILAQGRVEIAEEDWPLPSSVLEDLLADEGGNLLAEAIPPYIEGELQPFAQEHEKATYTKKFTDADALLDLSGDPGLNLLKIRAFDQNPRAYFTLEKNGRSIRVIVTDAEVRDGALSLLRVIPEGKKEMPYADFLRGQR